MLNQLGGFLFGGGLAVASVLYMDDIVYVPIRRAFVRPVVAYFNAYPSEAHPDSPQNVSDVLHDFKEKGSEFFKEMKPRDVSLDSIKDYVKDEDFRTREEHYFNYIRRRKEEEEDKQSQLESFVEKYSKQDYDTLKKSTIKDIYSVYETTKQGKSVEYNEFDTFPEMLQIITKGKKKSVKAQSLEDELKEVLGQVPSKSKTLLQQSVQYQTPGERDERTQRIEEMKKLEETINLKPDTLQHENITKFLSSYEGKYSVREVKKSDKQNLKKLRDKAVEPDMEYNYPSPTEETPEGIENPEDSQKNLNVN